MLDPAECFAAPISAARQMTLVLPRTKYEHQCLIVMNAENPFAICLDDSELPHRFMAFECEANDAWRGLHIPGVRIELDETSLFEGANSFAPAGSVQRLEDKLSIRVNWSERFFNRNRSLTILDGLPACAPHQSACFLKWQIVLGEGQNKRVLATIDATPESAPR